MQPRCRSRRRCSSSSVGSCSVAGMGREPAKRLKPPKRRQRAITPRISRLRNSILPRVKAILRGSPCPALIERKAGTVAAHKLLAELDAKAGNQDAAIEHYRRVLEIDPRNAGSLNNLAYLLAEKTGQTDEALKYAEQAKEIAPASSEVDDTLGWVYYRKGNYPTAVKYLETATANSSAAVRKYQAVRKYHLAMAYVKAGDLKQGQQTLEAALNIDSKLPEAQEALKVFAEVEKRSR